MSSCARRVRSLAVSGCASSMKCMKRASSVATAGSSRRNRSRSLAMRNAESAGGPVSCSMDPRASFLLTRGSRVNRHGELRDVRGRAAFQHGDLGRAVFLYFIDAQDRVHRQEGALDPRELTLDTLFGRVEYHRGSLAEQQLLHFDEAEQLAVADPPGVHLVNLALVHEHNPENVTGCHGSGAGRC